MTVTPQQLFEMFMESQFWSAQDMLDFQRSQLSQLLRHARANVPFYKSRLDCVMRHDGSIDWQRWEDIPVVTRADLRDRRAEMQATILPPGHGPARSFFSSGSSGVPIEYTSNGLASVARRAALRRMQDLYGFSDGLKVAHYGKRLPNGKDMTSEAEWFYDDQVLPSDPVYYIDRTLAEEKKLHYLRENKIDVYFDFATSALLAARVNLQLGRPVRLTAVHTFGMGLSNDERSLIEASFACVTVCIYSSKECGLIAYSCPESRYYHLCSELVFCESTRVAGRQPVIITPLFNTAQPLIRYDHGDDIAFAAACKCDSQLPVLEHIYGRSDTYFILNGTNMPIVGIDDQLLTVKLKALAFQIAQVTENRLEVRFVPSTTVRRAAKIAVEQHLKNAFPGIAEVVFLAQQTIPRNAGGKQNRYVREYGG